MRARLKQRASACAKAALHAAHAAAAAALHAAHGRGKQWCAVAGFETHPAQAACTSITSCHASSTANWPCCVRLTAPTVPGQARATAHARSATRAPLRCRRPQAWPGPRMLPTSAGRALRPTCAWCQPTRSLGRCRSRTPQPRPQPHGRPRRAAWPCAWGSMWMAWQRRCAPLARQRRRRRPPSWPRGCMRAGLRVAQLACALTQRAARRLATRVMLSLKARLMSWREAAGHWSPAAARPSLCTLARGPSRATGCSGRQ